MECLKPRSVCFVTSIVIFLFACLCHILHVSQFVCPILFNECNGEIGQESLVTKLQAGCSMVWFLERARDLFISCPKQPGDGSSVDTRGSFPRGKFAGAWCWPLALIQCWLHEWWSYTSTPPVCVRSVGRWGFIVTEHHVGIGMSAHGPLQNTSHI